MKALIAIISWVMGLVSPTEAPVETRETSRPVVHNGNGPTIVGTNPRTVVALEDTHFRPNR
jgi:hypothetical protein